MCGLGAILDPAGSAAPEAAQRMVDALRHRGPDGDAVKRIGPDGRKPRAGCRAKMTRPQGKLS